MRVPNGCNICYTYYVNCTIGLCGLCEQEVHVGPAFYCTVLDYELAEGQAFLGRNAAPSSISFAPWQQKTVDHMLSASPEKLDFVVCLDCLLSDL